LPQYTIPDVVSLATLAILVISTGIPTVRKAIPVLRPIGRWLRNIIIRDVLRRLDGLERRVDIIEAVQDHGGKE